MLSPNYIVSGGIIYDMYRLPFVPTAEELTDKAYRAGSKEGKMARSMGPKKREKILTGEIRRVQIIAGIICGDLDAIVQQFPSFEQMPPFQQQLLDLRVDRDRYKKSIATAKWCSERVQNLRDKTMRKLKVNRDPEHSTEFLGRVGSFVKRIGPQLRYLAEVASILRTFPTLKEEPTLVVAGVPNAGKSTFVRTLTGSKVKVAPYPFTTTDIMVGYKRVRYMEYQIVDSPGILDRPMSERNKVEMQAVLALRHLANKVLFIIDPQAELKPQMNLMDEMRENFKKEVLAVVNDKGTGVPEGYEVFNATLEADCERIFRLCFKDMPKP
jgi:nucleolar GTP-binding protein